MLLSVIVPCFNEEENVPFFYEELMKNKSFFDNRGLDVEVIYVDDGSKDGTVAEVKKLHEVDERVKLIRFSRNFGKEAAMYAGFCNAKGDYVAVMDADMQDPPSLLPQMLEILDGGEYDSVATRRVTRKGEPKIRSFFARRFYRLINKLSDADIVDGARDFRLMKRDMVEAIVKIGESNRFSKGIFGWIGYKTYWLPYENVERVAGETKWSFFGLVRYALDGIVNFSEAPLRFVSGFGLFFTFISALFLVIVVIRKLIFGDPVAGWASTMSVILFLGGIQMMCMGIMGKYIAKTYSESKKRPHYIIAESNAEDVDKVN